MRKLNTSDVFAALRLIRAANLREEIKPVMRVASEGKLSVEDVGIDGIISVVEMLAEKKAEKAMYEVLSGPFEMEPEEVANMELVQFAENLQQLAKENDLRAFFGYVSGILTKK